MKVLITGITGFVGQCFGKRILNKHEVSGLIRKSFNSPEPLAGIKYYPVDWDNEETLRKAVRGNSIVFHMAGAIYNFFWKDFYNANVLNTQRLFKICIEEGVKKFVFLSSYSAAGPVRGQRIIHEQLLPTPNGLYGKSKLMAEQELMRMNASAHMDLFIIRAPLIYGHGQNIYFTTFLKQLLRGKITLLGNGDNLRSFCFIENLLDVFENILENKATISGLYFIADKEVVTVNEFIAIISEIINIAIKVRKLPRIIADASSLIYDLLAVFGINFTALFILRSTNENIACDITNARKRLNYEPQYSLHDGIKHTLNTLKAS